MPLPFKNILNSTAPVAAPVAAPPTVPAYVPPEWTNGMSTQNWMGKDIYGQGNSWFMDSGGAQQNITGLYDNYQGYQGVDNGLAAGLMLQGNQNNLIQGWDGKFYSDMFPEFRRRESIGFDGYDFRDAEGNSQIFNKNGNEITDYLGWKPTPQNQISLASKIFGPDGQIITGAKDQVYSKYGLVIGGLNQNKDFTKDPNYVPADGKYSSMYSSVSNPDFSVRDYQLYADSDPLGNIGINQFYNASQAAGWDPILSGTDPILIDKTAYGNGYETWGRFAKYVTPDIGRKQATWNYYGAEADTRDQWEGSGPGNYSKLGKSYGGYLDKYNPGTLNSDVKNAPWLNDPLLGTGFAFSEDQKDDYGFAPNTARLDAKKKPSWQKVVGPLLTIASFIPGINVIAIPLNAAYNIGMGIKNGNWAQTIGGALGGLGALGAFGNTANATTGAAATSGFLGTGGSIGSTLANATGMSTSLSNALVSGGLGAIGGGITGGLAGGLGSYAGSYVGGQIGNTTGNYDLGALGGGLTNSMLRQLINTGKLNTDVLATQGIAGGLNALINAK